MGEYGKYCKTQSDEDFEKFYRKIEGLIYSKIKKYRIYQEVIEDVKQEALIQLYKASEIYNPDKKGELAFCMMIINRAIKSYLSTQNYYKNKILNESISLEKVIYQERQDITLGEIISDNRNIEDEIIAKTQIEYYLQKIKEKLSPMEYKIWITDIITQKNQSDYGEIEKITGYGVKEIDNAKQRIKQKIAKIRSDAE